MPKHTFALLATVSLCLAGCSNQSGEGTPATRPAAPSLDARLYDGCAKDLQALRKTFVLGAPARSEPRGSSPEACTAAQRIFTKIDFVGMSKADVIAMLGDPSTISDYGIPAKSGPDEPMTYRFDTGLGGLQYVLRFKDDKVIALDSGSLY